MHSDNASRYYVISGASGFLGRQLLATLASADPSARIFALIGRSQAGDLLDWLRRNNIDASNVTVLASKFEHENCGLAADAFASLEPGEVHFFHCAAHYDLSDDDREKCMAANVTGTSNAIKLGRQLSAKSFNHMSTIAVSGEYYGVWSETHFDEAGAWRSNYGRTKHMAEALVRDARFPVANIFRLGVLVGDARTGQHFKSDGIYGFFPALEGILKCLPSGTPLPSFGWGSIPICPVDHAATSIVALTAAADSGVNVFHLFEDDILRVDDILEALIGAADHNHAVFPSGLSHLVGRYNVLTPHDRVLRQLKEEVFDVLKDFDIPVELLPEINHPTQFTNAATSRRLRQLGVSSPKFNDYAPRIWRSWQAQQTIDANARASTRFEGANVLLTGGTSGIGRTIVQKLFVRNANIVVLGRNHEAFCQLHEALGRPPQNRLRFIECDLMDDDSIADALSRLDSEGWTPEIFVHAAGISIARHFLKMSEQIEETRRMTQVNFLSAATIIRKILPAMIQQGSGHIVSLSSISCQMDVAEYASYSASKAGLDQLMTVLRAELFGKGIRFSILHLPLVRTPMTQRNIRLRDVPMLSDEAAAARVIDAIVQQRFRTSEPYGLFFAVMKQVFPNGSLAASALIWRVFARLPYWARVLGKSDLR
ncbi:SDR family NAD(P)-dependent oxidoreductase [Paracoccus sulfuroxidans]|uniref:Short-subunit dehydrogenase n=1 Tax=Paracoccus sulfuroxidans TaxID=384678 RepID=A0A562NFI8_9RHOB|nr:SDR family NAD(P)-dependent oxidoreductase [Paracoccus sulfuroxidans]TWI30965.1 short-subunit dehydrogenase [Paracoccus sulfuroxidans]